MREPKPAGEGCTVTIFTDSNYAGDSSDMRSTTGIIGFYGSTPVFWSSKRQGAIAGSTYEAEFIALKLAVDEAKAMRYLLRGMGIPVTQPVRILGDNQGVLESTAKYQASLKKKHVGVAYSRCREAMAWRVCDYRKIHTKSNLADMFTKALGGMELKTFRDMITYRMAE